MSYRELVERLTEASEPSEELDGLIALSLKTGELPDSAYWAAENVYGDPVNEWRSGGYGSYAFHSVQPYTASLDAAIGLVEKVLPGWSWQSGKEIDPDGGFDFWTSLSPGEQPFPAELDITVVHDHSEPISIVLALLKALEAKEQSDD